MPNSSTNSTNTTTTNTTTSNVANTTGSRAVITAIKEHLNRNIIGQHRIIDRLLIALLADGHLLVEGPPGLAKTTAIKALSACIEGDFQRIQFTPDMLPGDLTGTEIFRPQDASFIFQQGPLFHNLILADEINRAPAKVQSALLEAMGERQITVGKQTYHLPELFLVMATQNPLEQEGTYPLPEAQLDRFLMYVHIDYPDAQSELEILDLVRGQAKENYRVTQQPPANRLRQDQIREIRRQILDVHMTPELQRYIVQVVLSTRDPAPYGEELGRWLRFGGSPRATISLDRCSRAHAWLQDRDYVSPEDIHAVAHDVLRHRVYLSYEAEAESITSDHVITELLQRIAIP